VTVQTSSSAAITSFQFRKAENVSLSVSEVSGDIDETGHTIAVTVPADTDLTSLVPIIAHTGASIAPNNDNVPHDFSAPFTYTVTAQDGTTHGSYVVTVQSFGLTLSNANGGAVLDETHGYEFSAEPDYGAQTPLTVKVTNTGNEPTGPLTAATTDTTHFTLTGAAIASLAVNGDGSFTVTPATGLGEGIYTTQITVSGGNGISAAFTINFIVSGPMAATPTGGANASRFYAVAKDASGNTYTVGYQTGNGSFNYGNSKNAQADFSGGPNAVIVKYNALGVAQWAKTVNGGNAPSSFLGVAVQGNDVYAVGQTTAKGVFNYGNNVYTTAAGTNNTSAVIVKYNGSNGDAEWVRTPSVTGSANYSFFNGVALDAAGNIYAAGTQIGSVAFDYGGQIAQGTNTKNHSMIVKYTAGGATQWAKTVVGDGDNSRFNGVALDAAGKVYAVGYITSAQRGAFADQPPSTSFDFGNSQTITISAPDGLDAGDTTATSTRAVIVQYDSSTGNALWAKSVVAQQDYTGQTASLFNGVTVDASGKIYAVGGQTGNLTKISQSPYEAVAVSYDYNSGKTAVGSSSAENAVIVQYDNAGNAQWVQAATVNFNEWYEEWNTGGIPRSAFYSVAVDAANKVYAAGAQAHNKVFTYSGVSATGSHTSTQTTTGFNAVVVIYNTNTGGGLWANSVTGGGNASTFYGVAASSSGNFSTAGYQTGTGAFNYGNGGVTGAYASGDNAVLLWYK
jgi:hypothetical protein